MILYIDHEKNNVKVEVNVLCCLISTAAMLQQAARERVDRWKRTEGRPQGDKINPFFTISQAFNSMILY
jgi:hypothetical protein